jgi:hypothetical protein
VRSFLCCVEKLCRIFIWVSEGITLSPATDLVKQPFALLLVKFLDQSFLS